MNKEKRTLSDNKEKVCPPFSFVLNILLCPEPCFLFITNVFKCLRKKNHFQYRPLSEKLLPRVEKFRLIPLVLQPNQQRSFLSNCVQHLSQNSQNNSYNWIPTVRKREDSPEFIELEAQIEALRYVKIGDRK